MIGKLPHKETVIATVLFLLFVLLVRSKRLEVLTAALPVLIILLSARSNLSQASVRIILAGGGFLALVAVAALRLSDELDWTTIGFYSMAEGIYAGHSLPGIILLHDSYMIEYEHGARFINGVLGFIPRFIWPEKDDMIFVGNLALEGVSPLGATSVLAEVVLQGGWAAVVGCYLLLGFVFQRLMAFQDSWDAAIASGSFPLRFGVYLITVAIVIPHFRDGIIPTIKIALQDFIVLMLISGMHLSFARPVPNRRSVGPTIR